MAKLLSDGKFEEETLCGSQEEDQISSFQPHQADYMT
jgi:hypothetical protein